MRLYFSFGLFQFELTDGIKGFISFTSVGYGDLSPETPAGRSIFVAWALLGVATMTILISSEYGSLLPH